MENVPKPARLGAKERLALIERVVKEKTSVTDACRAFGVSRFTFYKWHKRYFQAKPGEELKALSDRTPKGKRHWRRISSKHESKILAFIAKNPQLSVHKISRRFPRIGHHGVQNIFEKHKLNRLEKRQEFAKLFFKRRVLTAEEKLAMIERWEKEEESIAHICLRFGISRFTFYKWYKRFQEAKRGEELLALASKRPKGEKHWRYIPEKKQKLVFDMVVAHPEYSCHRLEEKIKTIGHHGIQNILYRNGLNTYEKRFSFAQAQAPVVTPIVGLPTRIRRIIGKIPVISAIPPPTRKRIAPLIRPFAFSLLSSVVLFNLFVFWLRMLAQAPTLGAKLGLVFGSVSLLIGSFFFAYSMKYYLTLALVLSFSRQPLEEGGGYMMGLNGGISGGESGAKGWLQRIFGLALPRPKAREGKRREEMLQAGGLQPSLDHIKLKRYPFVSIHLPFYNERKVAERILKACTSMDYPNFEIVVVDDSTDKTTEIVQRYAKKHNKKHPRGPKIKVLHRPTRQGFKGGALEYALKHTNPKAEFVVVLDADFIPYPDTLELFVKYFKVNNNNSENYSKSRIAVVGGYQWHVLNKSENWITRGVRTEYAGSYVIERPGREILGLIKQISGSVYMIRVDLLKKIAWGTSITEDFQLTLKLYEQGYKVIYTPYVQAPAECVSTLKRLIRQRMRWAEGHSNNIRKMFFRLMSSPKLSFNEKLEVLYLSPYYLQATFFLVGTFSWLLAETIFRARLPFWTSLWGWSLVLTNFFSLPLMNGVGLFLEESEERDYLGIISFIFLSYILVPFQAYASLKGFIEKEEGPWFRTPKTGKITDIFTRGRFYRWISGILPGWRPATGGIASSRLAPAPAFQNPYLALLTANNRFNQFQIKPKRIKGLANLVIVFLLLVSLVLSYVAVPLSPIYAFPDTFWFKDAGADVLTDGTYTPKKKMTDTLGTGNGSVTLQGPSASDYFFHEADPGETVTAPSEEDLHSSSLQVVSDGTAYGNQRKVFRDDYGNLIAIYVDSSDDTRLSYKNHEDTSWTQDSTTIDTDGRNVSGYLDSSDNLHVAVETTSDTLLYYEVTISRDGSNEITGISPSSAITLDDGAGGAESGLPYRPSLIVDTGNDYPMVAWSYQTSGGDKNTVIRYVRAEADPTTCTNWAKADGTNVSCTSSTIDDLEQDTLPPYGALDKSVFHPVLVEMPSSGDLLVWFSDDDDTELVRVQSARSGASPPYTWDLWSTETAYQEETSIGDSTEGAPFNLTAIRDTENNRVIVAFSDETSSDYTTVRFRTSAQSESSSSTDISPTTTNYGNEFSLALDPGIVGTTDDEYYYLFYIDADTDLNYRKCDVSGSSCTWDGSGTKPDGAGTHADPSAKIDDKGGRIDFIYSDGATPYVKYRHIPKYYRDSDDSTGTSEKSRTLGYDAWDYIYFITDTFSGSNQIGSENWVVKVCVDSSYNAETLEVRWQIMNTNGKDAVESSSWTSWSKSAGAGCDTTSIAGPSSTSDMDGYRLRAGIRWSFDGDDSVNLLYDGNNSSTNQAKITVYVGTIINPFYILTDNFNKKWNSTDGTGDVEFHTDTGSEGQRNIDMATDSSGNTIAVWEDERNSGSLDTFTETNKNMNEMRQYHTATLLNNGQVLITGGRSGSTTYLSTAELYDPANDTFTATTNSMNEMRNRHTATLLNNGKVLIVGGYDGTFHSTAEIYDPANETFTATSNSMNERHYQHTATLLNNGQVLIAGGRYNSTYLSTAEIYDPATDTFTATSNSMNEIRHQHTATLLNNGQVLITGGYDGNVELSSAEIYDPANDTFTATAKSMTDNRYIHSATLLNNGQVLITGGLDESAYLDTAEIYDPTSDTFTATANSMDTDRLNHTNVTLLNNGKVLIAGGEWYAEALSGAEIYDPANDTFTLTSTLMNEMRFGHTVTLLNNGQVLITGGYHVNGGPTYLSTAELYSPKTSDIYAQKFDKDGEAQWGGGTADVRVNSDDGNRGAFASGAPNYDHLNPKIKLDSSNNAIITWQQATNSVYGDDIWAQKLDTSGNKDWPAETTDTMTVTVNSMNDRRDYHTATLLNNGQVLVAGGRYGSTYLSTAELYDPANDTFTATSNSMNEQRAYHTATLLNNGQVLLAGGFYYDVASYYFSTAELYDPANDTFTATANSMSERRYYHTTTLLNNGQVLITGGSDGSNRLSTAELYDPANDTFTATANSMNERRYYHTTTLLNNGQVLLAGGDDGTYYLSTAELYDPANDTFTATTNSMNEVRVVHTATLLNNGQVLLAGGYDGSNRLSTAELYDPANDTFTATINSMNERREKPTTTLLNNGQVLIAGGKGESTTAELYLSTAELYDPANDTFTATANSMNESRGYHTTTLLNNGQVLIAGGYDGNYLSTAELYLPSGDVQVSNDGSPTNGYGLPSPEHPNHKGILGEQRNPVLEIDSSDNALIVWEDTRYNSIQNWGLSFDYDADAWWQTNNNLAAIGQCNGGGGTNNSCGAPSALASRPLRIMGQWLSSSDGARAWGEGEGASWYNPLWKYRFKYTIDNSGVGETLTEFPLHIDLTNDAPASFWTNVSFEDGRDIRVIDEDGSTDLTGQAHLEDFSKASSKGHIWVKRTIAASGNTEYVWVYYGNSGASAIWNKENTYNTAYKGVWHFDESSDTHYDATSNDNDSTTESVTQQGADVGRVDGADEFDGSPDLVEYPDYSDLDISSTGALTLEAWFNGESFSTDASDRVYVFCNGSGTGSTISMYDLRVHEIDSNFYLTSFVRDDSLNEIGEDTLSSGALDTDTWYYGVVVINPGDDQHYLYLQGGEVDSDTTSIVGVSNDKVERVGVQPGTPTTGYFDGYIDEIRISNDDRSAEWIEFTYLSDKGDGGTVGNEEYVGRNNPQDLGLAMTGDINQNPSLEIDGTNIILTWESNGAIKAESGNLKREGNIYAQKFDSSGVSQWGNSFTEIPDTTDYNRINHSATLLNNGKVLIAGTTEVSGGNSTAEIYDPATNTFSEVTELMNGSRARFPATLLNNGKVLLAGGGGYNAGDLADLFDPADNTFTSTGQDLTVERNDGHTATLLNNGKVLIAGGTDSTASPDVYHSAAELYDPATDTFTATTNCMNKSHHQHTATLLNNGQVLLAGGSGGGYHSAAELYDPANDTFTATTNSMNERRYSHTATLLNNGKVLLAGGHDGTNYLSTAELYDPANDTFTATSNSMNERRRYHTATLLNNGQVLLAGGFDGTYLSTAELYDPANDTFTATTNSMNERRRQHTATLLNNGQVLIAGGSGGKPGETDDNLSTAELYSVDQMVNSGSDLVDQRYPDVVDDGTNLIFAWQGRRGSGQGGGGTSEDSDRGGGSWKILGMKTDNPSSGNLSNQWPSGTTDTFTATANSMNEMRYFHSATLLNNGQVLITGGCDGNYHSTAELYDPAGDTFTATSNSMNERRYLHTATLLNNGKVLVAGGFDGSNFLSTAELFDPTNDTFTATSNFMNERRAYQTVTLLNNGQVLIAGGFDGNYHSTAELYDPADDTFTATSNSMNERRNYHTATLLNNGQILLAGGFGGKPSESVSFLSTAELYDPANDTFTATSNSMNERRQRHTSTFLNNGQVLLAGGDASGYLSTAELYDPANDTFTATTNPMSEMRYSHTATLLNNGQVLIAGGMSSAYHSTAELYDPANDTFTATTNSMNEMRYWHTAALLNNGQVLITGGRYNSTYLSTAELYNPAGELALSHDFGLAGDQEKPRLITSNSDIYVLWEDNRSSIGNSVTSDKNIMMQKFNTNGIMQWPAASETDNSPYAVRDIRVDTYEGGTQYSGDPAIGGIYSSGGVDYLVVGWEDDRNTGDPMDVYGQAYDLSDYTIDQNTNWVVYWDHNLCTTDLDVNVGIVEWDGVSYVEDGQATSQNWDVTDDAAGEDNLIWDTGGTYPPPSDNLDNITMRRLIVTFNRNGGTVTIYYDDSGNNYDSRLGTGTIVPEKSLFLGLVIPFLPPVVRWYAGKKRRKKRRV